MTKEGSRIVGGTSTTPRAPHDFYETDKAAIDHLMEFENKRLEGVIWENACGNGALTKRLTFHRKKVVGTDIQNFRSVYQGNDEKAIYDNDFFQVDFLKNPDWYEKTFKRKPDVILTNPPYGNKLNDWVFTSLDALSPYGKLYLFVKLTYLGGIYKYQSIWKLKNLEFVYIFPRRIKIYKGGKEAYLEEERKEGKKKAGSTVTYAWLVWNKLYDGDPTIKWFDPEYKPSQTTWDDFI